METNDRFVVIERIGNWYDLNQPPLDSLVVRYYIIDLEKKMDAENPEFMFVANTYDEFLQRKAALGISNLNFTKEFDIQ